MLRGDIEYRYPLLSIIVRYILTHAESAMRSNKEIREHWIGVIKL